MVTIFSKPSIFIYYNMHGSDTWITSNMSADRVFHALKISFGKRFELFLIVYNKYYAHNFHIIIYMFIVIDFKVTYIV